MYTAGIKVNLTEEEVEEAIDWGAKNKNSPQNIFLPWVFGKFGNYEETGTIFTKTCYLTYLGFFSAREYKTPDKKGVKSTLSLNALGIMVTTFGTKADLRESYRIVLQQGKEIIQPGYIGRKKEADPTAGFVKIPYYKFNITGFFPYSEIDPKAKTTIILIKPQGESRFEVDFSRYK